MKYKINATLVLLFWMLFCSVTQAEYPATHTTIAENDFYGQIDTIYSGELRIIIDDKSLYYSNNTLFLDHNGNTIINIEQSITQGSFVKYHSSSIGNSDSLLIDLKVISEEEFKNEKDKSNVE